MSTRKAKLTTPRYNHLLGVGAWNKLPHYAVIGDRQNFYLWKNDGAIAKNTKWIVGREAFDLLAKLRQARVEGRLEFETAFLTAYQKYEKNKND